MDRHAFLKKETTTKGQRPTAKTANGQACKDLTMFPAALRQHMNGGPVVPKQFTRLVAVYRRTGGTWMCFLQGLQKKKKKKKRP